MPVVDLLLLTVLVCYVAQYTFTIAVGIQIAGYSDIADPRRSAPDPGLCA